MQGSGVDSSLNDRGRAQAKAFFEHFKDVKFDKVYTSVLKRTQESVQSFIDLGIPHKSLKGLNEISWGTKEGYAITPDEDEYYHYMLRQWEIGNTSLKIEGGESPDDVVLRMKPDIDHIMSYEDILEMQKQRQEHEVRGLKRKSSSSVSWHKKSRVQETSINKHLN